MRLGRLQMVVLSALFAGMTGCIRLHRHPASSPSTEPMAITAPATEPVATQDLGTTSKTPGLAPKPKPFIALPRAIQLSMARPSQLLLEHASPDSPVPLSDYASQPAYSVEAFHLHKGLSAAAVQRKMGSPAQLADTEDPWLVYRLTGDREIWLHFSTGTDSDGMVNLVLDSADVIRGAEDGYVRDRVFSAN